MNRAVDSAKCPEIGRVLQMTRLEMLANVLRQGGIKVTGVKNLLNLHDLKDVAQVRRGVGTASPPAGSGPGSSLPSSIAQAAQP
mmetsp:Transcript_34323/g.77999  ORF Transcript_34323/g.77999 Transcript_34323/m.77999 type:complete len:84 (-) Transcript_34323:57-308(-)